MKTRILTLVSVLFASNTFAQASKAPNISIMPEFTSGYLVSQYDQDKQRIPDQKFFAHQGAIRIEVLASKHFEFVGSLNFGGLDDPYYARVPVGSSAETDFAKDAPGAKWNSSSVDGFDGDVRFHLSPHLYLSAGYILWDLNYSYYSPSRLIDIERQYQGARVGLGGSGWVKKAVRISASAGLVPPYFGRRFDTNNGISSDTDFRALNGRVELEIPAYGHFSAVVGYQLQAFETPKGNFLVNKGTNDIRELFINHGPVFALKYSFKQDAPSS